MGGNNQSGRHQGGMNLKVPQRVSERHKNMSVVTAAFFESGH
jgi:hypothetical protein